MKEKLIAIGRTAKVYKWEDEKVIKLFNKDIKKESIEKEYKITKKLYENNITNVKVFDLIEYENKTGIIFKNLKAKPMTKEILYKPWKLKKLAFKLAETHNSILKYVDIKLPRTKEILKGEILNSNYLPSSIKDKIIKHLEDLQIGNRICHGDFHPENILISNKEFIVIDWMTASMGNPLADVARTSLILKYGKLPDNNFFKNINLEIIRNILYKNYINHYMNISRVNLDEIKEWEIVLAATRLSENISEKEKELLNDYIRKNIEFI
ncbi:MAG: aminoglycoside phosphotransferase family protein [Firmicutes bacterium]|nr:aminoglycoside phosphotransferase family protein [Bacillota bacterium]